MSATILEMEESRPSTVPAPERWSTSVIAASEDALPNGIRDAVTIASAGAMKLPGIGFRNTEPRIEVATYWVFEMVIVRDVVSS
jgi:hypothetical protein